MRAFLAASLCILSAAALLAQTDLTPETLLLAKIKVRAGENLERLPNYTCLETIERSTRRSSGRFQLLDVLRMEVAFVGSKELYAWPGSQEFEDRELFEMVGYGAIGNGSFALHARSVFLSNAPSFTHAGEEIRDERRTVRYDYRVPIGQSGYRLRVRPAEGIVGYHGSFWADASTLDLIRLRVITDEIPPHVPILSASETLEYATVKIAGDDFLLPLSSELVLTDLRRSENRNYTRFTRCRQFAGDSVISFDDAPTSSPAVVNQRTPIQLDDGLEIEMKLETAIEGGVSAVGDAVRAVTVRDVSKKGAAIIPKGALVTGRIVKLRRNDDAGYVTWAVGVHLTRIEFGNSYAEAHLSLEASQPAAQLPINRLSAARIISRGDVESDPRIGMLYIRGDKGRIPSGFRMHWRTLTHKSEENRDSVRAGRRP
jgi:hypothetical protein